MATIMTYICVGISKSKESEMVEWPMEISRLSCMAYDV